MNKIVFFLIASIAFLFLTINSALAVEKIAEASSSIYTSEVVVTEDIRIKKLTIFLEKHNSPLVPHAEDFVKIADKYEMGEDWAMVAAIAGVESTFGKHIPKNSYNAWGWGIPTGARSGIGFDYWEDGIETVTKGLKERYIGRGADTLPKIGRIYAPPSTTWAGNVRFFMREIEETEVPEELTLSL